MRRCFILIVLALTTVCVGQENSTPSAPLQIASPKLSLVSLKPVARDELNLFFEYTVENRTDKAISAKLITIERVFSRQSRFDPKQKSNEYAGKTGFGSAKAIPPGGTLARTSHARLVGTSGKKRLDAGYRYLHVRVIPVAPASDNRDVPADVGTINLEALPTDLPSRPPDARKSDGGNWTWSLPGWIWQPIGMLLLVGTVWIGKGIGAMCWLWLPRKIRVFVAVPIGGVFGAAVGSGFVWISPFSDNFGFFVRWLAPLYVLFGAIQAGRTASGSKKILRVGDGNT